MKTINEKLDDKFGTKIIDDATESLTKFTNLSIREARKSAVEEFGMLKEFIKSEVEAMLEKIIAETWFPNEDGGYIKTKTLIKIATRHGFDIK